MQSHSKTSQHNFYTHFTYKTEIVASYNSKGDPNERVIVTQNEDEPGRISVYKFIWRKVFDAKLAFLKGQEDMWALQGNIIFKSDELINSWVDQIGKYSFSYNGPKRG